MERSSTGIRLKQVIEECTVHIVVITCKGDYDRVITDLSVYRESSISLTVVQTDVESAILDEVAIAIEEADVIIIGLSSNFAVAKNGYQTLIFASRTLQKPFRYFNLMHSYVALVTDPQYISSNICMLVGVTVVYTSLRDLFEGWAFQFKTTEKIVASSDSKLIAPLDGWKYFCCFAEENHDEAMEIMRLMPTYTFTELRGPFSPEELESPICAIIFVTQAVATRTQYRAAIDSIIIHNVPLVVVVINDVANANWLRTGLGILLANELWVDFRRRPFYTPGENVPSMTHRIHDLSVRLKNACLKGSIPTTQILRHAVRSRRLKVFQCHCWADSDHAAMGKQWPITNEEELLFEKEHDTMKYAISMHKQSFIKLGEINKFQLRINSRLKIIVLLNL